MTDDVADRQVVGRAVFHRPLEDGAFPVALDMQHEEVGACDGGQCHGQPRVRHARTFHRQEQRLLVRVDGLCQVIAIGKERSRMAIRAHAEQQHVEGQFVVLAQFGISPSRRIPGGMAGTVQHEKLAFGMVP